jgi:hypothetical protein
MFEPLKASQLLYSPIPCSARGCSPGFVQTLLQKLNNSRRHTVLAELSNTKSQVTNMCRLFSEHFFHECGHIGITKVAFERCDCLEIQYSMHCRDGDFCPPCSESNLSKDPFAEPATKEAAKAIEEKIRELMKTRRRWRLRKQQLNPWHRESCSSPICKNADKQNLKQYWPDMKYSNMRFIPAEEISQDRCGICWGSYNGDDDDLCDDKGLRLMLPCGHVFGKSCIEHALYQRGKDNLGNHCPLCTVEFYPQHHDTPEFEVSIINISTGEMPTNRLVRAAWSLVFYLSSPWFFAVIFVMEVGPKYTRANTRCPYWRRWLYALLVMVISPVVALVIFIVFQLYLPLELRASMGHPKRQKVDVKSIVVMLDARACHHAAE